MQLVGISHCKYNDYSHVISLQLVKQKVAARNKCATAVGHDDHADQAVRCQGHCPTKHNIQGYLIRSHWTPTLGKYSPRVAPADTMVINFGVKNWVVALWNCFLKLAFKRHETDPLLSSPKLGAPAQELPPFIFFQKILAGFSSLTEFRKSGWWYGKTVHQNLTSPIFDITPPQRLS